MVRRHQNAVLFGLRDGHGPLLLADVRAVMHGIADCAVKSDTRLVWRFSSLSVSHAELCSLSTRWDETGEPPLLSFIGVDLGARRHLTRGMAAFIGYEIAAEFDDRSLARHAARNLARLARHALMHGGLAPDESYQATDGTRLGLTFADDDSLPKLVTIVFQSIRNGFASG